MRKRIVDFLAFCMNCNYLFANAEMIANDKHINANILTNMYTWTLLISYSRLLLDYNLDMWLGGNVTDTKNSDVTNLLVYERWDVQHISIQQCTGA